MGACQETCSMIWVDPIEEEVTPLVVHPAAGGICFLILREAVICYIDILLHDGFDLLPPHMAEVMH